MQSARIVALGFEGLYLQYNMNTFAKFFPTYDVCIGSLWSIRDTTPLPQPPLHWRSGSVDGIGDLLIYLLQQISRLTLAVYFSFFLNYLVS